MRTYGRYRVRRVVAAVVVALVAATMALALRGFELKRHAPATTSTTSTTSTPATAAAAVTTASAPQIGILVGTSPADHELNQAAAWTADARMVAAVAARYGAHVVLDRIGAGPGSSEVLYDARVASGNGQNALIRGTQLQHAKRALVRAFATEQATTTPGLIDVIGGVDRMEEHLAALPRADTTDVVIFGSAVQTAAPINLADPVQLADPEATLRIVAAQGLLRPNSCVDWRVSMVGGSLTPTGGLSALQDEQLREFWREFFAACGGRLVLWDSTLIAFPASGQVQPASWTAPGHRQIIIDLTASVLFEPDQAVLRPGAAPILDAIADKLLYTYPDSTADIAGYTADVGGGNGLALSRARAQVVADLFEALHVSASRLTVRGYGDTDQIRGGPTANRRVVVTLNVGPDE